MRLKRLDLYGYKSFATRTTFEFSDGITAIVGPNGSGKSNIADAIRWVLGEQSYRALRAKSTEDMIFAGSRHRARLGMAEVLITLDNSDNCLPIDYTDVTVGRRAYRSGETEYLLNGNRVRYRDILELLGNAGALGSSYIVIGQGMVDAALSLRPEARRVLFEEAAGIAPHLRKREEALRRIEETEHNLERINDILNELRPTANSLRRQAERAEEYMLLNQDLRELQRIWYGHQWQRRQRQLARAEERLQEQFALLEAQRRYTRSLQDKQARLDALQTAQRQAVDELVRQQGDLRAQLEALQREHAVMTERIRLYTRQRSVLEEELRSLASRRDILTAEVAQASRELSEQEAAQAAYEADWARARQEYAQVETMQRTLQEQVAQAETRLAEITVRLSDINARLDQANEQHKGLVCEEQSVHLAIEALEERLRAARVHAESLSERQKAALAAQAEAQRRCVELETEIADLRERVAAGEQAVSRRRIELEQLVARRDLLARQRQEAANYAPGVRELLGSQNRISGLIGTVANILRVPAELEQAIESALGPRLQNIVTERWEDAEAAIAYLKHTRAGWVTFLPLDTIRSRTPITLRPESGVVGVASGLIGSEERFRPVVELLLGSVVVVRDLATARALLNRRSGASLFVTLEGETVQPSGALSGGARRQATGLLAQEREWRALPERIASANRALEESVEALAAQRLALTEAQRRLMAQEQRLSHLRSELDEIRTAAMNHAHDVNDLERDLKWRISRQSQLSKEIDTLAAQIQSLRTRLAEVQGEQADAMRHLAHLREQMDAAQLEGWRRKMAELEMRVAVAQRTVESQRALLQSHDFNLNQLVQQTAAKQDQETSLRIELQGLEQAKASLEKKLADAQQSNDELQKRMAPLRRELGRLEQERRDLERQRAQSQQRLSEVEIEYNRALLERDRAKDEQTALSHEIEENLGPISLPETISHQLRLELGDDIVELPRVESLPPGLSDEIRQLKTRIRRLGDVNPNAPQEYQQLLERQTFLQGQMVDLRGAIASLHEVLQDLDATIERDFIATINRVDGAFREYFRILFGGGTAHLVLTDPDRPSTTGVDILAQPPGKRAQTLSLLSGGERALVAVALLFALLRVNPVPFCCLDEVDAALDEANVRRFRQLLEEHARTTQFVVITHNRHTIECATTIYGVSMSEQGVSQSISLRLCEDVERYTQSDADSG